MKRTILFLFLCVSSHFIYGLNTRNENLLEEALNDIIVDNWFSSKVDIRDDNSLLISLYFNKSESDLRKFLNMYAQSCTDKNLFIESLDSLGFNSDPYKTVDYSPKLYGYDNPIFSFQKGWIATMLGLDYRFENYNSADILYYSKAGQLVFIQKISTKLKEIVVKLDRMGLEDKEIASLIASKLSIDNGVRKNQEMTPYELDLMSIMSEIELTDNSYIYKVIVPSLTFSSCAVSDYIDIKNKLEKQLGDYVAGIPFFCSKGAALWNLKIEYVYQDENNQEYIKYSFNPYTKECEILPIHLSLKEKFDFEKEAENNILKWIELGFQEVLNHLGYGDIPIEVCQMDTDYIIVKVKWPGCSSYLTTQGYNYFHFKGSGIDSSLSQAIKLSNYKDNEKLKIGIVFEDNDSDLILFTFFPNNNKPFEMWPVNKEIEKTFMFDAKAAISPGNWFLVRSVESVKDVHALRIKEIGEYKLLDNKNVSLDIILRDQSCNDYLGSNNENVQWFGDLILETIYSYYERDKDAITFDFLKNLEDSCFSLTISFLQDNGNDIINKITYNFPDKDFCKE